MFSSLNHLFSLHYIYFNKFCTTTHILVKNLKKKTDVSGIKVLFSLKNRTKVSAKIKIYILIREKIL